MMQQGIDLWEMAGALCMSVKMLEEFYEPPDFQKRRRSEMHLSLCGFCTLRICGTAKRLKRWWAMQGLNLRPHPCEGCALPLS